MSAWTPVGFGMMLLALTSCRDTTSPIDSGALDGAYPLTHIAGAVIPVSVPIGGGCVSTYNSGTLLIMGHAFDLVVSMGGHCPPGSVVQIGVGLDDRGGGVSQRNGHFELDAIWYSGNREHFTAVVDGNDIVVSVPSGTLGVSQTTEFRFGRRGPLPACSLNVC